MPTWVAKASSLKSNTGWNNTTVSRLSSVDAICITDGTAGDDITYELDNVPADFGYNPAGGFTVNVYARVVGTVSRQKSLTITGYNSSGTAIDSATWNVFNDTAPYQLQTVLGLTSGGESAAYLDGLYFGLSVTEGGGMPDSAYIEVDYVEFNKYYLSSTSVTVQPTSVLSTTAVGTASVTVGTDATVAASGVEASSAVGSVAVQTGSGVNVSVTGLGLASSSGSTSQAGTASVLPSGSGLTSSIGTVTASGTVGPLAKWYLPYGFRFGDAGGTAVTVSVTGVGATSSVGTAVVAGTAVVSATGALATVSTGTVATSGTVLFGATGVSASTAVGSASVTAAANIPVSGVQAATALGTATVTAGAVKAATGVQASALTGTPTVTGTALYQATGVQSQSAVGTVTVTNTATTTVFVSGVQATSAVGTVTLDLDAIFGVTGNVAQIQVGTVTVNTGDVPQRVGGGLAPKKRRKQRTFKEEREARKELERAVRRAVAAAYGEDAPTVLVSEDAVSIVGQQSAPVSLIVPPQFNADAVARLIAAEFARIGVESKRRNTRLTLEEIQERDRQRVLRRKRQDNEIFLLIEGL